MCTVYLIESDRTRQTLRESERETVLIDYTYANSSGVISD